uniref:Uncharacterized protein n=1 Tax=Chromera velia CCMP2878 TaxID=1169474 RepID=A0A0G4H8K7_9ALVE|eukprot:Cvel_5889.t1-p1 / transcript=Cvel_5889.t1 / gene=Cvel_5889 / organism=Chromera_velia_CCMP2878 / gene_product=hypothetical protein / transcript_product=hypothetical protein / location=Cvel_scaffold280:91254-98351(+) / protein_length=770 / sequence_SO=supercontig / SO=protein_coding / is_pseudo=false
MCLEGEGSFCMHELYETESQSPPNRNVGKILKNTAGGYVLRSHQDFKKAICDQSDASTGNWMTASGQWTASQGLLLRLQSLRAEKNSIAALCASISAGVSTKRRDDYLLAGALDQNDADQILVTPDPLLEADPQDAYGLPVPMEADIVPFDEALDPLEIPDRPLYGETRDAPLAVLVVNADGSLSLESSESEMSGEDDRCTATMAEVPETKVWDECMENAEKAEGAQAADRFCFCNLEASIIETIGLAVNNLGCCDSFPLFCADAPACALSCPRSVLRSPSVTMGLECVAASAELLSLARGGETGVKVMETQGPGALLHGPDWAPVLDRCAFCRGVVEPLRKNGCCDETADPSMSLIANPTESDVTELSLGVICGVDCQSPSLSPSVSILTPKKGKKTGTVPKNKKMQNSATRGPIPVPAVPSPEEALLQEELQEEIEEEVEALREEEREEEEEELGEDLMMLEGGQPDQIEFMSGPDRGFRDSQAGPPSSVLPVPLPSSYANNQRKQKTGVASSSSSAFSSSTKQSRNLPNQKQRSAGRALGVSTKAKAKAASPSQLPNSNLIADTQIGSPKASAVPMPTTETKRAGRDFLVSSDRDQGKQTKSATQAAQSFTFSPSAPVNSQGVPSETVGTNTPQARPQNQPLWERLWDRMRGHQQASSSSSPPTPPTPSMNKPSLSLSSPTPMSTREPATLGGKGKAPLSSSGGWRKWLGPFWGTSSGGSSLPAPPPVPSSSSSSPSLSVGGGTTTAFSSGMRREGKKVATSEAAEA